MAGLEDSFEMLGSQEEKKNYNQVPEDMIFKFKIVRNVSDPKKFAYKLKKEADLPCIKEVGEFTLTFSQSLEPSIPGHTVTDKFVSDGNQLWTFKEDAAAPPEEFHLNVVDGLMFDASPEFSNVVHHQDITFSDVIREETGGPYGSSTPARDQTNDSSAPGYIVQQAFLEVVSEETGGASGSSTPASDQTNESSAPSPPLAEEPKVSVHFNPDWLKSLKTNFTEVVAKCSAKVIEAVQGNVKFGQEDVRQFRLIRSEIIHTVVEHLNQIFGGIGKPKLREMREVANQLAFLYPAMFRDESDIKGYGLGGRKGVDGLANNLLDSFRALQGPRKKNTEDVENLVEKKVGKRKYIYGVDNDKWYKEVTKGAAQKMLSTLREESQFEEREAVYENNREELMEHIRKSKKAIKNVCRGFFSDFRHVENQFKYLSGASLVKTVDANFEQQMQHMEKVILEMDKTLAFREFMDQVEMKCDVEYDGSKLYKWIILLRKGAELLQKNGNGSAFLRIDSDGAPDFDGPFILAVNVDKTFVFELWVEKEKLFGNMSITESIASFLHLAFVFDLCYPKAAETMCDIIQRRFAKYGDNNGTRTNGKKESAATKISKFMEILGNILSK